MEKGKVTKIFTDLFLVAKKISCQIIEKLWDCFSFLVKKVEAIDPTNNNMSQRIKSSLVLIPIAVYAIFVSKDLFLFLVITIAILMTIEWLDIIKNSSDEKRWRIIGFFYIAIPLYAVAKLRMIDSDIVFWMFSIIWVTDIFAFFSGKIIGGKKLAPHISPNKTWAGLAGGVAASAVIGFISSFMFYGGILFFVFLSMILSVVEQLSDLMESKIKRTFNLKDSGNIIPGHGGILDRLDGMMLVAPTVLILVALFPRAFGV